MYKGIQEEKNVTLKGKEYTLDIKAGNSNYSISTQGVDISVKYKSEKIGKATASLQGEKLFLDHLVIFNLSHQHKGLGSVMIRMIEMYARKIEVREIEMNATAYYTMANQPGYNQSEAQDKLEKFYERHGYIENETYYYKKL